MMHDEQPAPRRRRRMGLWVRLALVAMVLCWIGVFAVALRLNPYQDDKVWLEETHRQLGLPECTFKSITKLPCPSCGMTSAFALLVRGDLWNALKANAVGAGLAVLGAAFVPWALISVARGRWLWFRRIEDIFIRLTVLFLVAMFARWGIVLLLIWWNGS
jgi:hypothetical protein